MATRSHLARNTQINDLSVLRLFVAGLGNIQVGHTTPQHVENYFLGPDGAIHRNNPSSYNKIRSRIEGFLAFCSDRGYNRQPWLAYVKKRKTMRRDRLRLTPQQMLDLLRTTHDARDRPCWRSP